MTLADLWKRAYCHLVEMAPKSQPPTEREWRLVRELLDSQAREYLEEAEEDYAGADTSRDLAWHALHALQVLRKERFGEEPLKTNCEHLPTTPPKWWQTHCQQVFACFEEDRLLFLKVLGLIDDERAMALQQERWQGVWQGPLTREQAVAWLDERLAEQNARDLSYRDSLWPLTVPRLRKDGMLWFETWAVYGGSIPPAKEPLDLRQRLRRSWLSAHEPLMRLLAFARQVTFLTENGGRAPLLVGSVRDLTPRQQGLGSCTEGEAVLYALCGEVPTLPWLAAALVSGVPPCEPPGQARRWAARDKVVEVDHNSILVYAATPDVPPAQVAEAYARARALLFNVSGSRRRTSPWPDRVIAFVDEFHFGCKRKHWHAAYEAFKRQYPECPYKNANSFKVTYQTAVARLRTRKDLGEVFGSKDIEHRPGYRGIPLPEEEPPQADGAADY